jgi:hypothetical protein
MTLQHFIRDYDKQNSVVLLEGKRDVSEGEREMLVQLGKLLASSTRHMIFRSGNADGADYYFSLGIAAVDKARLQVVTPYTGHRQKANQASHTISLEEIDLAAESEVIAFSKSNAKMGKLVDQYIDGKRDRFSIKAAYIIRDTIKVTGVKNLPPASFALFYDDLSNPRSGGTGHTMNVCHQNHVPFLDQKVWFGWLVQ